MKKLEERIRSKSNLELVTIINAPQNYQQEAVQIAEEELEKRGGYDSVMNVVEDELELGKKEIKYRKGIIRALEKGKTKEELLELLASKANEGINFEEIIEEEIAIRNQEKIDKSVSVGSLFKGIIGGLIGGTFTGILWGMTLLTNTEVLLLIPIGLALINYLFVKFSSRKSFNNIGTFLISAGSILYSYVLGVIVFQIFG